MNEIIPCKLCKLSFEASDNQQKFILESREKKMNFIMLNCSNCKWHTDYNPTSELITFSDKEIHWRTPVSRISGYVSYIENDEEKFYGCGESGFIWLTKERFYKSIEEIIAKYPHRNDCYIKVNGEWFPNNEEPDNMEELIETEDENDLEDYVVK